MPGRGGVTGHRDGTRGAQFPGGGAIDAIAAVAGPGDGQRTEVAARAGPRLGADIQSVGPAAGKGDVSAGRDDVSEDVGPDVVAAVPGDRDAARGQQVARRRRREAVAGARGRRTAHRRSDPAGQGRALDDEISARDRHRVGQVDPDGADREAGIGSARTAGKDHVSGDGRRDRRSDVDAVVVRIGMTGQGDRPGRADRRAGVQAGAGRGGAGDRERADIAHAADGDRPQDVHALDAFAEEHHVAAGGHDRPLGVDACIGRRFRGDQDVTSRVQRTGDGQ